MSTAEADLSPQGGGAGIGTPGGAGAGAHVRRHHFSLGDPLFRWFTIICAATVALAMFVLIGVLVKNSWFAIHVLRLKPLTTVAYNPGTNQYGALSSLFGTFMTTLIAMVIAVPLALAIALLLVELVHPAGLAVRGHGHRDAGRGAQHHLRHVGHLRPGASHG